MNWSLLLSTIPPVVLIIMGLRRIPPDQVGVVLMKARGKMHFVRTAEPGTRFVIPFVHYLIRVETSPFTEEIPGLEAETSDGKPMMLDVTAEFQVIDPAQLFPPMENFVGRSISAASEAVRAVVAEQASESVLSDIGAVAGKAEAKANELLAEFGMKTNRISIKKKRPR